MKCCICGKDAGKYGHNPEPIPTGYYTHDKG